jgi:hypothetical protein
LAIGLIVAIALFLLVSLHQAAGSPGAPAGTLANEPFATAPGALNGLNDGAGWGAAWEVQNGNTAVPGYNIANAAPLTYPGVAQSGGYAIGGAGWIYSGRTLDTSASGPFAQFLNGNLIGISGQTIYVGFLMRKDADTDDEMSVTLHSSEHAAWWVKTPGIAIGHFGAASNTNGTRYWSFKLDGVVHQSGVPVAVGKVALVVVRITFGATGTVSLFVNPPADALPATPDATASSTNSLAFNSLAYYGGSGTNQSSLDEIRFSASYAGFGWNSTPAPPAPSHVAATPGSGQVTLSWDPVQGASTYQIFEILNGVPQLEGAASGNNFTVAELTNGTSYMFYVVTVAPQGSSVPSAQVTGVPRGTAAAPRAGLGTNLSQVTDYSRELPFIDAFKSARPWISQLNGAAWGQGPALKLDANGWIQSLAPGQYAETILLDNGLDDQPDYPTGQYILLYDGAGTIAFDLQSASIVSQTPPAQSGGRMVVDVPAGHNGVFLMVTATNPSDPIRNIRFIMPGFEDVYKTQIFHPLFISRLRTYRVLRFMEWMLTNGSLTQNWSDRPTTSDYTYSWRGVPLEVMIGLANGLRVSPWFNIPAKASDDYVQHFAAAVKQQLNTAIPFYLEYSNETWNGGFSQNAWIANHGQSAGLSADPVMAAAYYTAVRATSIFDTFQSALGGNSRMIRVIASQAANSWLSDQTLGFRNAWAKTDALAIAPYFNCSDAGTGGFGVLGDPANASQVAGMTPDQVVDIELAHINGCALEEMQSNAAVARKYGLTMVGYEGGQSLVGYNGAENNAAMTAVFKAANRSTRMTSLYTQYLTNWADSGGGVFVHFTDVGAYTKYGDWGALEFWNQDPNAAPKYQALLTFAAQHP